MGRAPCCSKVGLHRGPWTPKEDLLLTNYIKSHGEGHWRSLPKEAGLLRCGKSCRLRWMNYLRPDIKRGNITAQEDDLIIRLHSLLGNRWSLIAGRLPGRTDNEIKNYWNTRLSKTLPPLTEQSVSVASTPKKTKPSTQKTKSRPKRNSKEAPAVVTKLTSAVQKHTVHQPKPVRLGFNFDRNLSYVQSSDSSNTYTNIDNNSFSGENTLSSYASSEGDQEAEAAVQDQSAPWSDMYGFYEENGLNNNNGSDQYGSGQFDQHDLGNNNGVWDKLFDEYLQLTNGGSGFELQPYAESLLI